MKIKKKIWGCLLSLLCIFMLVLPVMASESPETDSEVSAVTSEESAVPTENPAIPEERQKPLLVDNAGLLTEEESNALLNKLEDISQKYENEVGIVTVNSLEGKTAEAYADDYYDYNGYDFSIYYDFDYGHNGSDNCMESNLPEDYYEDYYSDTVQNAYELLCSTDEVSYYLGLGFFVWYTGNKDMIDDKECRVFVLGKDLDDHIEVKNHYAVSDNQVYYLDVIENTWNILGSG